MKHALPLLILLLAAPAGAADSIPPPVAYQAESAVMSEGTTNVQQIWSDGVHTRRESTKSNGDKFGSYTDAEKKLTWVYGPTFPCVQVPSDAAPSSQIEERVGSEMLDGHPTQKFKVSTSATVAEKAVTKTAIEWRATDLGNLVIQWTRPDGMQYNLRHIVVGAPDAKAIAFPSPPCKYDASKDTSHYAAEAPGGFRVVSFFDLACGKLVPIPLAFALPSDFEIRKGGHMGCFAGRHDDLARLLKIADQADFDSLQHAVIWVRVSDSTEYDPLQKHFVSDQGTDDRWADAFTRSAGATQVKVIPQDVFGIPSLRVTATIGVKTVHMLYFGVGDSPAILISYQPAGNGTASDETDWRHFLDSIAPAK